MNDGPVEDTHGAAEAARSLPRRRGVSSWAWPAAIAVFLTALLIFGIAVGAGSAR